MSKKRLLSKSAGNCVSQLSIIQEEYADDPYFEPECIELESSELDELRGLDESYDSPESNAISPIEVLSAEVPTSLGPVEVHPVEDAFEPWRVDAFTKLCYNISIAFAMSPLLLISNTLYIAGTIAWCSQEI